MNCQVSGRVQSSQHLSTPDQYQLRTKMWVVGSMHGEPSRRLAVSLMLLLRLLPEAAVVPLRLLPVTVLSTQPVEQRHATPAAWVSIGAPPPHPGGGVMRFPCSDSPPNLQGDPTTVTPRRHHPCVARTLAAVLWRHATATWTNLFKMITLVSSSSSDRGGQPNSRQNEPQGEVPGP